LVYLVLMVGVLVRVAFIILFERKILSYVQIRKGPNRVGYTGILQSFGDAIKLFLLRNRRFLPFLIFHLIIFLLLFHYLLFYYSGR